MKVLSAHVTRILFLTVLVSALGACGLPRPGPSKSEMLNVRDTATQIVVVDERVSRTVSVEPSAGFPDSLLRAGSVGADRISEGDTLSITIYENVENGVLSRGNSATSVLDSIQVDEEGFIFIPYVGRIRAVGNSTERLRQIITDKLGDLTPEPQVLVKRAVGDGATVSVVGDGIASQGVYPLQRSSRRLMETIASAGGIAAPAEVVRIVVLRNQTKGEIWFEDIYDHPEYDIALRAGDRVIVQRDPRTFTILGATGTQANVPFGMRQPSALQAIAQGGGLDGTVADPTGLFVIRNQEAEIANMVLDRNDLVGEQSIIYVLDLTKPSGLPLARGFDIRDGDTIYVTEAPYVQWNKTLEAISGSTRSARTLEASVGN